MLSNIYEREVSESLHLARGELRMSMKRRRAASVYSTVGMSFFAKANLIFARSRRSKAAATTPAGCERNGDSVQKSYFIGRVVLRGLWLEKWSSE
jgi:hypothetical protein